MVTIGVEEEYLLLDVDSGLPVPRSRKVRTAASWQPMVTEDEVTPELLQAQVEVATPICSGLDEIGENLVRLRNAVSAAAAEVGCRAAACGAAALRQLRPVPVTLKARYLAMSSDAAQLVDEQLINGMHVHVAVPDREAGVVALNRIRPWLPVLVALGANSPLWDGRDTGFSSWRTVIFGRWPASGPPPEFADAADYLRRAQALVDTAAVRDLGQLYWLARLSEKYPTIEVRAFDVQLRAEDAVILAGVVRGLITQALSEDWLPGASSGHAQEVLAAATWMAARYGLEGELVDPTTGRAESAARVAETLLDVIGPALKQAGDLDRVTLGVRRLVEGGSGAARQRRAFESRGLAAAVELAEL
ncbi:MAG TPA: glutamate--cysteine ligase [Actinospica sp.]|jgi:carboxylate-amine ligase|nr:glutamate--cysteine ligase [Actinospica sp.]